MATLTVNNMLEMAKAANTADQARGDDARGRQLRHHDGQPRGGLRQDSGLRAGAARALQPQVARLHRRAVEGQGGAGRTSWSSAATTATPRSSPRRRPSSASACNALVGPGQRRLLEPEVHRREPRADRASLRRQLLAQPADARAKAVFAAYQKRFSSTMANHGVQGYQVTYVLKDAPGAGGLDRPGQGARRASPRPISPTTS